MKILWLSWKDKFHPLAGGAEVVTDQLLTRLAKDGHDVTLFTASYPNAGNREIGPYRVVRSGGRLSVYLKAFRAAKRGEFGSPDLLIEEINTVPFFSQFYGLRSKRTLFFHQLAREVWFFQMFFPLNILGYLIEPLYLKILSSNKAIVVSESTKNDLCRYGFKGENVSIVPVGIELEPVASLKSVTKFNDFTLLSLGAIRPMKRTLDQIKAFEHARSKIPELKLIIAGAGEGGYFNRCMTYIKKSQFSSDVTYLGRVSSDKKVKLMQQSHAILVTSIKEGWGLIVTEANSQGTPAVVYNVDGLRDSTKNNVTGLVSVSNTPTSLAEQVIALYNDKALYSRLRNTAWEWSKEITFENSYNCFKQILFIK